jgi:hypothetical protein
MASDIFISYKREDRARAQALAEALAKRGWDVWWDPRLRSGEHFDDVIERELQSARRVIVLWSSLSVQSQFVKDEASYALELGKLAPVLLERVDPPFRFKRLHTVDLSGWSGEEGSPAFEQLAADLAEALGSPPEAAPKPKPSKTFNLEEAERVLADTRKAMKERKRIDEELSINELEDPEAEALRQRALVDGDSEAAFQLGMKYRKGESVPQDNRLAWEWLSRAGSHAGARAVLKRFY